MASGCFCAFMAASKMEEKHFWVCVFYLVPLSSSNDILHTSQECDDLFIGHLRPITSTWSQGREVHNSDAFGTANNMSFVGRSKEARPHVI